jgi:hypothetical protein
MHGDVVCVDCSLCGHTHLGDDVCHNSENRDHLCGCRGTPETARLNLCDESGSKRRGWKAPAPPANGLMCSWCGAVEFDEPTWWDLEKHVSLCKEAPKYARANAGAIVEAFARPAPLSPSGAVPPTTAAAPAETPAEAVPAPTEKARPPRRKRAPREAPAEPGPGSAGADWGV